LRTQADSAARHLGGLVGLTAAGTVKATGKQGAAYFRECLPSLACFSHIVGTGVLKCWKLHSLCWREGDDEAFCHRRR